MSINPRNTWSLLAIEFRCFLRSRSSLFPVVLGFLMTPLMAALSVSVDPELVENVSVMSASQYALLAGISATFFMATDPTSGGHFFLVERRRRRVLLVRLLVVVVVSVAIGAAAVAISRAASGLVANVSLGSANEVGLALIQVMLVVSTAAGIATIFPARSLALALYLLLPVFLGTLPRLLLGPNAGSMSFWFFFEQFSSGLINGSVEMHILIGALVWPTVCLTLGISLCSRRDI